MIILEFTNDRVKLLTMVRRGGRITLANLAKASIEGFSDAEIAGAVADLIRQARIKRGESVIIALPRYQMTVRNIRIPSVDDDEIAKMVDLQAVKQLPYAPDDLIWDHKVIEKRDDGYSDIFLAMVHRDIIDRYVGIAATCRLDVERILLRSETLLGWYIGAALAGDRAGAKGGLRAVVDIDTSYAELIIVRSRTLLFSRSFPCKDSPGEIADEIQKTLDTFEKDGYGKVSLVTLTGIEERGQRLKPILETIYGVGNVEFSHTLKVLSDDYQNTLADYLDLLRDVSFSGVLGIIHDAKDISMDFLSHDDRKRRQQKRMRALLTRASILCVAIVGVLLAIFLKVTLEGGRQLNHVNTRLSESEPKVRHLKQIAANLDIIKRHLDTRGSSIDIIREVYGIIPQGISILIFDFELEKSLTLRGTSPDLSSVFKFSADMGKSSYFESCEIRFAQKRTVNAQEIVDFELGCALQSRVSAPGAGKEARPRKSTAKRGAR
ncbi:MAG: pilus assembly protein PilM [Candidatus Omnitrophota bacterium]